MKITRRQLRKIISEVIIKEQNEPEDADIDKIINLMMDDFDYGLELLGYFEPPVSLRYVRGKVAKRMNSMSHEDKIGLRQEEYHGLRDVWTNLYKRTSFLGIGKKGINEYRIKPSVDDPEDAAALDRLSRLDSEELKVQARELAPQLGYPGDYVKDVEEYDTVGMYKTLGPLSRYLSSESREAINSGYNKNLLLTTDYHSGDFNIEDADTGIYVVTAREIKKAAMEMQLEDPDYNHSEIDWHNYSRSKERELRLKLIIEIINNSKITKVNAYQFTLMGGGEYKRNRMGKVSEISLEGGNTANIFAKHLDTTRLIAIDNNTKKTYKVRAP